MRFCVSERTEAEADAAPVSKMQIPSMDGSGNPQPLLHYCIHCIYCHYCTIASMPNNYPPLRQDRWMKGKEKELYDPTDLITPPQSRKAWNQNPNRPSLLLKFSSSSVPADTFFSLSPAQPPARLSSIRKSQPFALKLGTHW